MSGTEQLKKKKILRVIWSAADESMVIDLWHEKIAEVRGERKNSHILQEMAVRLQEAGFSGSWRDVRTKFDNLTRKYRQEKIKIGSTGGSPSSWEHFHKINNILGSFKLQNIQDIMHESTDTSTLLNESQDIIELDPINFETEQPCSSRWSTSTIGDSPQPQAKKRKMDVNAEIIKLGRERNEMQKQINEERKQQMMEMVKRLDTISSQNAAFQNELLSILREKKDS